MQLKPNDYWECDCWYHYKVLSAHLIVGQLGGHSMASCHLKKCLLGSCKTLCFNFVFYRVRMATCAGYILRQGGQCRFLLCLHVLSSYHKLQCKNKILNFWQGLFCFRGKIHFLCVKLSNNIWKPGTVHKDLNLLLARADTLPLTLVLPDHCNV